MRVVEAMASGYRISSVPGWWMGRPMRRWRLLVPGVGWLPMPSLWVAWRTLARLVEGE